MDVLKFFDSQTLELECSKCRFYSSFFYKQARLEDVIICRGCKTSIILNDNIGSIKKVNKQIQIAVNNLEKSLEKFGNIKIKF
jgi:hypothetical protein